MPRTRAQAAGESGPTDQTGQTGQIRGGRRLTAGRVPGRKPGGRVQKPKSSPIRIAEAQVQQQPASSPLKSATAEPARHRGTKRSAAQQLEAPEPSSPKPKRPRWSPGPSHPNGSLGAVGDTNRDTNRDTKSAVRLNPIDYWVENLQWPQGYVGPEMERLLAGQKPVLTPTRKRSNSAASSTSSEQRAREETSSPYRDPRYEVLLGLKGSFMTKASVDVDSASKSLAKRLLEAEQNLPERTAFRDEAFDYTCKLVHNKNDARVVQDISRLIVPSAENLAFEQEDLRILAESVNDGWNCSLPLTGTRPQPDYAVGFARSAFTSDQLAKLSPFIGDFLSGDKSLFMATYYMYFPFLACEVRCGASGLDIADRQNAHSMTLAVRAVAELSL